MGGLGLYKFRSPVSPWYISINVRTKSVEARKRRKRGALDINHTYKQDLDIISWPFLDIATLKFNYEVLPDYNFLRRQWRSQVSSKRCGNYEVLGCVGHLHGVLFCFCSVCLSSLRRIYFLYLRLTHNI